MKVLYSYIAGIDPIFSKEGFRVLMTFKDDDNTFVFFVDDSNSNASIARVKSTRFAGYSMDNMEAIENDEQFNTYIDWVQKNYNYTGRYMHGELIGNDINPFDPSMGIDELSSQGSKIIT